MITSHSNGQIIRFEFDNGHIARMIIDRDGVVHIDDNREIQTGLADKAIDVLFEISHRPRINRA